MLAGLEKGMLRPWELNVDIVRESGTALHVQIAQKIIDNIQSGRFTPGVALPGTRDLANKIKVNRKTVIQAYDELISEGWLISENKRGTFVSNRALAINHHNKPALRIQHRKTPQPQKELTSIYSKRQAHDLIQFSEGLPDVRLLPLEMLSRAMRHALIFSARNNKSAYGDPKGSMILREAILQMLNIERGLHANLDNLCIVRGSQMGIFLAARIFIEPNDCVVLEQLCNPLARDAFKSCGAKIQYVSHDDEGLDVDNLQLLCELYQIRAVYVTPQHQIPTTVCMSQSRRKKLLALAEQYDFLIIEDDSDHEFNYSPKATLPLASIQASNHVIYIGSLSKTLTSGFRIGYMVAPKEIIQQCANQISLIDRQGDIITELAIAELLHTGEIKRHNLRTLKIYEERYTFIISLIRKELSEFVSFTPPKCGLAIWLKVCSSIDMYRLLSDAEVEKVSMTSGTSYSASNNLTPAIRLGFANLNNDEIRLGIQRLKAAFLNQDTKLLSA